MEQATTFHFEIATPSDFEELLNLYQDSYPSLGWNHKTLQWAYTQNPAGAAHTWIARNQHAKIVSTFTAVPHRMWVQASTPTGWRMQDLITQPQYRGLGLYHTLSRQVHQFLDSEDSPLNFTFPNHRSHRGFIHSGWNTAFPVPLRILPTLEKASQKELQCDVTPLNAFGPEEEAIWRAQAQSIDFAVDRNAAYLNWRYFKNPKSKYAVFRLSHKKNRLILILKSYVREDGSRWTHICDLLQEGRDLALGREALTQARNFALERGC